MHPKQALLHRPKQIIQQLPSRSEAIRGSLIERRLRCGKPNCHPRDSGPMHGRSSPTALGRNPSGRTYSTPGPLRLPLSGHPEPARKWEPGHKGRRYLLVPPGSAQFLPTLEGVTLYGRRMFIEQGFRDFQTYFGARGLPLQVRITETV